MKGRTAVLASAILAVLVLAGRDARAHQDPVGCQGTGLTLNLFVFFADGTNSPGAGGSVSECESLLYRGRLAFPGGGVCAFEGGQLIITTPDNVDHDVTPPGGIPKLGGSGGVSGIDSLPVTYQVRTADIVGGQIAARIRYQNAKAHTGPGTNDAMGVPNGGTSVPNTVQLCPLDTECVDNFCDPALQDDGRRGLCTAHTQPDSTPCPDTDGNACTMAGCESGVCLQTHNVVVCPPDDVECTDDLCNPQTGQCEHPPIDARCDDQNPCNGIERCDPTMGCEPGTLPPGPTTLLLRRFARLGDGSRLFANVRVNDPGGFLRSGRQTVMLAGTELAADTVSIGNGSRVFRVRFNTLIQGQFASVAQAVTPLALPLTDPFCPIPTFTCGGPSVIIERNQSQGPISPGSYGQVIVKNNGLLTLEPGAYQFCSLFLGRNAEMRFTGGTESTLDVTGTALLGDNTKFGPDIGSMPPVVHIAGMLVRIGASAEIEAFMFAPDARLKLGRSDKLRGTFCADRLFSDNRVDIACPEP